MKTHSRVFVLLMLLGVVLHVRCRPSGQERISYGTKVPKGSMKYFVTLSINQGNGLFDCGGSLISPTVVVTAAHCLYSDNGELTSESIQISGNKAIAIGAAKPKLYNPFQNGDFTGDIALVKFDTAVGRDVVRLAPRGTKLENTEVLVAGKGQTEQDQFSKELKYIIVPTMSKSEILNFIGLWDEYSTDLDLRMPEKRLRGKKQGKEKKDAMYKNRAYEDDHFGAGDRKADSCRGDSGGPAIWPSKSSWGKRGRKEVKEDVLVGIVSYGPAIYRCGDKGSFGLYTDVGYWEEWINKTMDEDEFEKLT